MGLGVAGAEAVACVGCGAGAYSSLHSSGWWARVRAAVGLGGPHAVGPRDRNSKGQHCISESISESV